MASMRDALRDGSVSMSSVRKVAGGPFNNNVHRETHAQPSKLTHFEDKYRNEGGVHAKGHVPTRSHIDEHSLQKTGSKYMPSSDKGRSSTAPKNARSSSPKGGRVMASDTPYRDHIDDFPAGQHKTFPAGASYAGGHSDKTGNTRMKAKQPIKSGGPQGHNAKSPRYYGGPKGRDSDGTHHGR